MENQAGIRYRPEKRARHLWVKINLKRLKETYVGKMKVKGMSMARVIAQCLAKQERRDGMKHLRT